VTEIPYSDYLQRGTNPAQVTTANGAQPLLPEDLQKEIIKNATEMSAAGRFMKKRRLSRGVQRQAVLDTKPTAYFLTSETGLKQTTTMTWRNVFLNVEEIAVIVPIPIALTKDLDYDMWEQVRPEIEEAIGVALDAAIFFGTGAPASWPTAITTAAIAAANTVTQGAGVDVAADINNVLAAAEADGYFPDGMVMRQDMRASLRGLRTTTNEFVFQDGEVGATSAMFGSSPSSREGKVFGLPARSLMNGTFEAHNTATANATKLIAADWSQFVLGVRQDIDMEIFREGVIQDGNGDIQFNLLQQDMIAARFVARYAWAVPNPTNRVQPTQASRYPASVLRDAA
jgi:HK97 family phage major capsid protein